MGSLKLASCMAENTEPFCEVAAAYMQDRLGIRIEYIADLPWQDRERLFDTGEIQILWLCGLPYVHKADLRESNMELLVLPVPIGSRYKGVPVYFSDVVVKRDSCFKRFEDLRGSTWAYNEPRSHSGYNVVRAHLAGLRQTSGFFGKVVESGAHMISLEMLLEGQIDAAAIDSTVLEWAIGQYPDMEERIRVIESLGPSPIPPWVVSTRVPELVRFLLRALLLDMHDNELGRCVLRDGRIDHFTAQNGDYGPIRRMAQIAESVYL
jgi:ABC-type phosphate/phosphonate transport system substrate-binding protein